MSKVILQLEADVKSLKDAINNVNTEIDKLNKKQGKGNAGLLSQFKKMAPAIAAAFSVQEVTQFLKTSAEIAGQAEGIEKAFKKLGNANLLSELREATQGTISDFELMQNAVKANNFKIPLENLASYMAFASQRAQDTGESIDYLVESIVTGVARQSLPILDNLGLSATEIRNEMKSTGDMALAVGNIIDKEFGEAGATLDTSSAKTAKLQASFTNMQVEIGRLVNDGMNPFKDALRNSLDSITSLIGKSNEYSDAIQNEQIAMNQLASSIFDAKAGSEERLDLIKKLKDNYPDFLKNISDEEITNKMLRDELSKVNDQYRERILLQQQAENVQNAQKKVNDAETKALQKQFELNQKLIKVATEFGIQDQFTGSFEENFNRLKAISESIQSNSLNFKFKRSEEEKLNSKLYSLRVSYDALVNDFIPAYREELKKAKEEEKEYRDFVANEKGEGFLFALENKNKEFIEPKKKEAQVNAKPVIENTEKEASKAVKDSLNYLREQIKVEKEKLENDLVADSIEAKQTVRLIAELEVELDKQESALAKVLQDAKDELTRVFEDADVVVGLDPKSVSKKLVKDLADELDTNLENENFKKLEIVDSTQIDDFNELNEAFAQGSITREQYYNALERIREAEEKDKTKKTLGDISAGFGSMASSFQMLSDQQEDGSEKQEKYARTAIRLANLQTIASNALALVKMKEGLAKAFALGFPANLIAIPQVLAMVATISSTISSFKNVANPQIQGYFDGTEFLQGNSAKERTTKDGIFIKANHGERIIPTHLNERIGQISNEDLTRLVETYDSNQIYKDFHKSLIVVNDTKRLEKKFESLEQQYKQTSKMLERFLRNDKKIIHQINLPKPSYRRG